MSLPTSIKFFQKIQLNIFHIYFMSSLLLLPRYLFKCFKEFLLLLCPLQFSSFLTLSQLFLGNISSSGFLTWFSTFFGISRNPVLPFMYLIRYIPDTCKKEHMEELQGSRTRMVKENKGVIIWTQCPWQYMLIPS